MNSNSTNTLAGLRPFPCPQLVLAVLLAGALALVPAARASGDSVAGFLAPLTQPIPIHDGAWIDPLVEDHRVVLVGEELHGIADHLELKIEVAHRLLSRHGFTHIFIEDDVFKPDSLRWNLSLKHPQPSARFFGDFFWCWNVEELHVGFDSLTGLARAPQVFGIDVQTPRYALRSLRGRVRTTAQAGAIDSLQVVFGGGRSAYAARDADTKRRDTVRIDALAELFRPDDIGREQRHLRRVQRVWAEADDHGRRMNARDLGMADSVIDVLERDPSIKAVVFAHNAHAGYEPFYASFTGGVVPLGRHLRDRGVSTLSIGAVFSTGANLLDPRAREREGGAVRFLSTREPETQAVVWASLPHQRWLLDLRKLRDLHDSPAAVSEFLYASPAGHFDNYGPERPLADSYDLLVGYRHVGPATPPPQ